MNKVEEAITEYWGERCPDIHKACFVCKAWGEYDKLKNDTVARQWFTQEELDECPNVL